MNQLNYEVEPSLIVRAEGWVTAKATNAAVVITLDAEESAVLLGFAWGYSAPPVANATVKIEFGESDPELKTEIPITQDGPGSIVFSKGMASEGGSSIVITLSAGGAGIVGYLNVLGSISIDAP
jgi:hypothetical protein